MAVSALGALFVATFVALAAGQDDDAVRIMNHRLTPENVKKALAVDPIVAEYVAGHQDAGRSISGAPREGLDVASEAMARIPELAQAFQANATTAGEYLLTIGAIMYADLVSDHLNVGRAGQAPGGASKENVEFWRSLPPDLKGPAEDWKKRQQTK